MQKLYFSIQKSILRQTHKNFELIIIDDFSDDSSAKIITNLKMIELDFLNWKKNLEEQKL